MRLTRLLNARGEVLDMSTTTLFLHTLSGFGFEREDSYRSVGNRWIRTNKKYKQQELEGTILFNGPDPYGEYYEFIQFCTADPLLFEYTPSGNSYYRRCFLQSCEKKELEKHGKLECKVKFISITPWFRSVLKIVEQTSASQTGWKWGSNFWPIPWSNDQAMVAVIASDTNMDSPCKLTIYGPITNPSWEVYSSGELASTGKVTTTVPEDCYLVIDNTSDPFSIKIYDQGDTELLDVYQNADFSTERFITLKRGSNVINIKGANNEQVDIKAEGELYYESV